MDATRFPRLQRERLGISRPRFASILPVSCPPGKIMDGWVVWIEPHCSPRMMHGRTGLAGICEHPGQHYLTGRVVLVEGKCSFGLRHGLVLLPVAQEHLGGHLMIGEADIRSNV